MKIAFWHFHTFRLLRGIETLTLSLANALARRGVEVSLLTAQPTIRPLVVPDPRVRIYSYPTARYFEHQTIVPFYACHLLRHKYDHVVAFFADFGEGATWRLVHRLIDVPLSLYLCYPYSGAPHRYHSFIRHGWGRSARRILADADWIAREAQELFGRPIGVTPVGTDPARFRPDAARRQALRRHWGFSDDDVVLLNVSALEERKGVWRVIQALARVRQRAPNLRYLILGQGADEERLRKMARDLHLNDVVAFAGVTSELEGYYNLADVFVMLPDNEGNSVACIEAMSSALPVVASRSGGFLESVPREAGRLVDLERPEGIDDALAQFARDRNLRAALGAAGRKHALENYTWDRVAERFLEAVA